MKTQFKLTTGLAAGALALASSPVLAQDAADPLDPAHMEDEATDTTEDTDLSTPADPMREFTDAEIESFAAATTELRELDPDGAMDASERQAQAGAIVEGHGLTPEAYNAIGTAAQADPEIAERVREAMAPDNPGAA